MADLTSNNAPPAKQSGQAQVIEKLLRLRRIPRSQLFLEWRAGTPAHTPAEEELMRKLGNLLRQELSTETGSLQTPQGVTFLEPAGEDVAQLRYGGLMVVRRFVGNAEVETGLLAKWIRNHWSPLLKSFDGELRPNFLALILHVELSTEGILEENEERQLLVRYFRPIPGWNVLADAEFRITKEFEDRYYLNFGLSTYRTFTVQFQTNATPTGAANAQPVVAVQVHQQVTDRGLKVQVDVNTKVNVLKGRGDIAVTPADLEKCLTLAIGGVDSELGPILRMSE